MIAQNPLHRSGRAVLPHPAPTSGDDAHSLERIGVAGQGRREPSRDQLLHPLPVEPLSFTPAPERMVPVATHLVAESGYRGRVHRHPVIANEPADHGPEPTPLCFAEASSPRSERFPPSPPPPFAVRLCSRAGESGMTSLPGPCSPSRTSGLTTGPCRR